MTIADIRGHMEGKMDQSIANFKNTLTKVRTGRANPALLDTVQVEYYGSMAPESGGQPQFDRCPHDWNPALGKGYGCEN